jgi:tetratricopeptide (TPR) repeat protein
MLCPICAHTLTPEEPACPSCRAWIAEYRRMVHSANALFNDGVKRMKTFRYAEACQKFAMAIAYRPDDEELLDLYALCAECAGYRTLAIELYGRLLKTPGRDEPDDKVALRRLGNSADQGRPAYIDAVEALYRQSTLNMGRALEDLALGGESQRGQT